MTWNLIDWKPNQLEFALNFTYPLNVSQADAPDMVMILLNIHEFTTDQGDALEMNTILEVFIPR